MPRQARIDIAGQVYHVMSRGIERRVIFHDNADYSEFHSRIAEWVGRTGAKCLAWCLMPNHFHFVILRGERPLSELMHRAMTGYAMYFNRKYRRAGHLFQNRYKAILCSLEDYLLELVPYVHLNPLRAKLVNSLEELAGYGWCGHGAALGGAPDGLTDREELLRHYGLEERAAVVKYQEKMMERAREGGGFDFSGGGLLRSNGGACEVLRAFKAGERMIFDERVLGDSAFVESVLRAADAEMNTGGKTRAEALAEAETATGVSRQDILRRTRERTPAGARAIYCYFAIAQAGCTAAELAIELGITLSAVSKLALKGRALAGSLK